MFIEGILMILPFMMIRKFSGGYHLNSSVVCFISSTLLLSTSLALIGLINSLGSYDVLLCAAVMNALQIFVYSPIDSKKRKLSKKEQEVFREIARLMVSVFLAFSLLLYFLGAEKFAVPIWMGIIITALLQLPCIFTRKQKSTLE